MTREKPESAADPRPNNQPYFIDVQCQQCGEYLVPYHVAKPEKYTEEEHEDNDYWYDEFWCEKCEDGIHLDWPKEYKEKKFEEWSEDLEEAEENFVSLDEISEE